MMEGKIRPERLYLGFLKLNFLIGLITVFVIFLFLIIFLNSQGFKINLLWSLPILLIIILGEYFRYWFTTRVYLGKTIKEGKQRELKQVVYLIIPFGFLLALIFGSVFIQDNGLTEYIITLAIGLFTWVLFFWRLCTF